jgi:hypothetical protein
MTASFTEPASASGLKEGVEAMRREPSLEVGTSLSADRRRPRSPPANVPGDSIRATWNLFPSMVSWAEFAREQPELARCVVHNAHADKNGADRDFKLS